MKFCKKCHKRVVEKFNGVYNYFCNSVKLCQCNIHVVDDGSKMVVQRRKGFVQYGVTD